MKHNFNCLREASMAFGWMHLVKSFHGKMPQILILRLAREELQFFEHFAPYNHWVSVGCTPNKKSHSLLKHLQCKKETI